MAHTAAQDPAPEAPTYELSELHQEFRAAARDLARKELAPRSAEVDERGGFPHDTYAIL
ncbi:acyl-CoA dehydrogenase family protein, partial [Streptomyces sp. SID11233]|nr:acyl-CoA dehydrogenase family protein [Streptomyces sp. SID11233]